MRRNLDFSQSIFALASGNLPSAVAILRLSGPGVFETTQTLFRSASGKPLPRERGLYLGDLVDGQGAKIDSVLALTFVAPHSFTGEDVIEFQCHGSTAIVRRLEKELIARGIRPAERGEFSYRAYSNDKLSLAELERMGDLYLAVHPPDLDRIYGRSDRSLFEPTQRLREKLLKLQAILDTAVDFSEEYSAVVSQGGKVITSAILECSHWIARYAAFSSGYSPKRLVLAGSPNAGKSSLFNSLLTRSRAIVHSEPGTTRDTIEESLEIEGRPWRLVDTAGIREASGFAEREGVKFTQDYLEACNAWILVVDATCGLNDRDNATLSHYKDKPHLIAWNKRDRLNSGFSPAEGVLVSAHTGEGLDTLWAEIRRIADRLQAEDRAPLPTAVETARLRSVVTELEAMHAGLAAGWAPEVVAERNRLVIERVTSLTGEITVDEVLGRIFSEFCIGK